MQPAAKKQTIRYFMRSHRYKGILLAIIAFICSTHGITMLSSYLFDILLAGNNITPRTIGYMNGILFTVVSNRVFFQNICGYTISIVFLMIIRDHIIRPAVRHIPGAAYVYCMLLSLILSALCFIIPYAAGFIRIMPCKSERSANSAIMILHSAISIYAIHLFTGGCIRDSLNGANISVRLGIPFILLMLFIADYSSPALTVYISSVLLSLLLTFLYEYTSYLFAFLFHFTWNVSTRWIFALSAKERSFGLFFEQYKVSHFMLSGSDGIITAIVLSIGIFFIISRRDHFETGIELSH